MRTDLIALRGAGATAALLAATIGTLGFAPSAAAGEEGRGSVWVTPSTASPGAQVELRVNGCDGTRGSAKSEVFVADAELSGRDGGDRPLYGEAMISSHARPGRYSIHVRCDGQDRKATGSIQIEHHQPTHRPSHHETPMWPVHAGGGGMSAELTATAAKKEGSRGPGLPHTVIGALLAAAATLAVAGRALTLRRRRSGE